MDKNSTKERTEREINFASLEDLWKVITKPTVLSIDRSIFFDGRQYICKLPKTIMEQIWLEGSKLRFILTITPEKEIKLGVRFVQNGEVK